MSDQFELEFRYRGHRVQVRRATVQNELFSDCDTVFAVLIDGRTTAVPGVWRAYQQNGLQGIELVIKALLDCRPGAAE